MADTAAATFVWYLPLLDGPTDPHRVGDPNCPACCGCGDGRIGPCAECGGYLHVALDDEIEADDDWTFVHSRRCDRPCGCFHCEATNAHLG